MVQEIPRDVAAVVADVLGDYYHSHTKLNTLFLECGAPGDPPSGNCIDKCREWFNQCNLDPHVDAVAVLGRVVMSFMERDRTFGEKVENGQRRINDVLSRNGMCYEAGGKIGTLLARVDATAEVNEQMGTKDLVEDSERIHLFISHSQVDSDMAKKIVSLFRSALGLSAKQIRCTSVAGYGLPAGATVNDQLRIEVFECTVFVALLSRTSLASTWVQFEIGARWGAERKVLPLIVDSTSIDSIKGPLEALHILRADVESDLHQLLDEVASEVGSPKEGTSVFLEDLQGIVTDACSEPEPIGGSNPAIPPIHVDTSTKVYGSTSPSPPNYTDLSAVARRILQAAAQLGEIYVLEVDELPGPIVNITQPSGAPVSLPENDDDDPTTFAELNDALTEIQNRALARRSGKDLVTLTSEGFRVARILASGAH